MHEGQLLQQILDTVPHWYRAEAGPVGYELEVNGERLAFYSHTPLGSQLSELHAFIQDRVALWAAALPQVVTLRDLSSIRREIVVAWLQAYDPEVQWERLFAWADNLEFRTSENHSVTMNLILSPGEGGTDITEVSLQKGLDSIATSGQVFLEVDKQLRFLDYRQILHEEVCQLQPLGFNPGFLDPFVSVLGPGQWSFHITEWGDTIILDKGGLKATCRKGRWIIYDRSAFIEAAGAIFRGRQTGINVLLGALDLSYRRRGALLVFDPERRVVDHLVGCACHMVNPDKLPTGIHALLAGRASTIRMGAPCERDHQRKLLLELATIDGAVVFDEHAVLAFGGILHMHDSAQGFLGARMTAAHSAYAWGGVPVMISADGEMTIVFESHDAAGAPAGTGTLSFL